jgi:predicted O-methyltransferase YrrM
VKQLSRTTFPVWQSLGLHVTPNDYAQPVPDTRTLGEGLWESQSELPGIEAREEEQIELLRSFDRRFGSEYRALPRRPTGIAHDYYLENPSFGPVDAEILYCMIRAHKPRRIVEIGSGFSTYLAVKAVRMNAAEQDGAPAEVIAVDPDPDPVVARGFPGLTGLIRRPVEELRRDGFAALGPSDILFIDSSHVLRIGGDVQHLFLEVLPRIRPGVLVHVHDVFLPAHYPRDWVMKEQRFWSEQYVLQAFLMFNRAYEVLWAASLMHLHHPTDLSAAFPSYDPHSCWPGSFWIRRVDRDP